MNKATNGWTDGLEGSPQDTPGKALCTRCWHRPPGFKVLGLLGSSDWPGLDHMTCAGWHAFSGLFFPSRKNKPTLKSVCIVSPRFIIILSGAYGAVKITWSYGRLCCPSAPSYLIFRGVPAQSWGLGSGKKYFRYFWNERMAC